MFKPSIIGSAELRMIPVKDNGELLVRADKYCPSLRYTIAPYIIDENDQKSAGYVRETVARMIGTAYDNLPEGYGYILRCGFRSPILQTRRLQDIADEMMRKNPGLTEEELQEKLDECISPVDVAPHCTGGAIDVFLCDNDGNYIDIDCVPSTFDSKTYTYSDQISEAAKGNRKIMIEALSGAGLTNFPGEIWHWAYGEYDWAAYNGMSATLYGPVELKL